MTFQELFTIQFLNSTQWLALVPLIALSAFSILALVLSPLKAGRFLAFCCLLSGILVALLALAVGGDTGASTLLGGTLVFDRLSAVFSAIVLVSGLGASLMTLGQGPKARLHNEFFPLIGLAMAGMLILVSTQNLVMLFIGLELLSLAVYVLVAMRRDSPIAAEAGLKYFLLGGAASSVLLFGVTLIYGSTGSLQYPEIHAAFAQHGKNALPLLPSLGLGMIGLGFLFKIGAVPFHMWIPDVYTGAATPVTGFMISAVKAAAIGALLRFCSEVFALPGLLSADGGFDWILSLLIVATLLLGSLAGLQQQNLKRLFAYSTIAHTGYLLLGFMALIVGQRPEAAEAIASYTLFYAVMNIGAFAVLAHLNPDGDDHLELKDLAGLSKQRPYVAFALSVFLLSMAGIPPTAGFFGKYYLFMSSIAAGEVLLTLFAVLASLISVVYYLRPLVYMYMRDEEGKVSQGAWGSAAIFGLALVMTLFMGLVPSWFSGLLQ